jgi:hypothetical protein
MTRSNFIFISILLSSTSCFKVDSTMYLKHSKFIVQDVSNNCSGGSVTIRHTWRNKDFTASKGELTKSEDCLTLKFEEFFSNEFDLYNKEILSGDTSNINWDFILNDKKFVKESFSIYLYRMLSSEDLRVITFENFGLLRLNDNYHLVLNLENDPIGEFVTIGGIEKTLIIHKEGVVPLILTDSSKFAFKRRL